MERQITIGGKTHDMPKMSIDTYMEYLDLAEAMEERTRYTRQDMEAMGMFVCKAYGNKFTYEELKDPEKGLDPAELIMEFQMIDMSIADKLTKKMEKISENF